MSTRKLCTFDAQHAEFGSDGGDLLRRQFRLRPELHSRRLGAGDAVSGALVDEVALEFANGREHVEQQTAGWRARVDRLVEHDEVGVLGRDLPRDLREIQHGAGQTIELRHHELVAVAHERERLRQGFTLAAASAAPLFLEDALATSGAELVELDLQLLPGRRYSGVSDFHVS